MKVYWKHKSKLKMKKYETDKSYDIWIYSKNPSVFVLERKLSGSALLFLVVSIVSTFTTIYALYHV